MSGPSEPTPARCQPAWLGEEGFEDLTARWLAACNTEPQEKAYPASHYAFTTASESGSEKDDSDQQRSHSPSLALPKDEDYEVLELKDCRALNAIRRSMKGKAKVLREIRVDNRVWHKMILQLKSDVYADEDVSDEELRKEARETYAQVMWQKKQKKELETFKLYLLAALETYEKDWISARNGEVIEALEKIVGLEKGKQALEQGVKRPSVDSGTWKEIVDWVVWEAEDYCWLVWKYADVNIDAGLLVRVKGMLEHCKKIEVANKD